MTLKAWWNGTVVTGVLSRTLPAGATGLRLRTKLLLSFVMVTAGLTCATLLIVRGNAQAQMQHQIEQDARNATLMFQVMEHQHLIALRRKADLLAELAYMRNGDPTALEEASGDPWKSDDFNMFALADKKGKIVAVQSTTSLLPAAVAEEMLQESLKQGSLSGWWANDKSIYQVVLVPYYEGPSIKGDLLGTVVAGRAMDTRAVTDLGRISSSQIVFRYGENAVVSTLAPLQENDVVKQLQAEPGRQQVQIDNEPYFVSSVNLPASTHPTASLAISGNLPTSAHPTASLTILKSYKQAAANLTRLNHLLLGLGLVAVLAGGAIVFLISDTYTRPLAVLLRGVRALEEGNFTYPIEARGGDELARVTRAFDGMRGTLQQNEAKREQLEEQLRQAQKMEALGRLAGGVAHDFNNLLTVIKGHSELLIDRMKPTDVFHGSAQQIMKTADRAASLTRQLLAFSRMQVLQPRVLDLNTLVADMSKLLRRLIREDIEFSFRLGDSLGRVKADPSQLEQVLLNLTVNASDAMDQGGKLTIETKNLVASEEYARTRQPLKAGRYVMLAVTDTGHGMDAVTKSRIFEPFFTTKEPGKGTGLGLATVYGVVSQSGGFIWVETSPGNGTRFEIYLPAAVEKEDAASYERRPKRAERGSETVLIVEDDEEVRSLASEFLRGAGYHVLTAEDGKEALEISERMGSAIQLLLADVVMPRMRGPELARRLKARFPELKIVFMSGYLDQATCREEILQEAAVLQKPFSRDALLRQIRGAFDDEPYLEQVVEATYS
jgi:signal transduction histidine kinase/ActR/RegA family two-component response regulator